MGLFSRKPSDSRARIEELKKKIQAEQAAFAATAVQPAPAPQPPVQPAAPVAVQAPVPPPAAPAPQPVAQAPPPQPAYQPPVQQWQAPPTQPVFYEPPQPRQHAPPSIPEDLFEEEDSMMEEIKTGIILDLGDGMSLNLPIKSRMRLDEFLRIADRVRELQRAQQHG